MKKKLRKIPTSQSLANIALHYLGCYAASESSLRRVLTNRICRAAMQHPDFAADLDKRHALDDAIDKIIETHVRTGVLNDAAFATAKTKSLRRQGRSARAIQQKLAVKGIKSGLIKQALVLHDDGAEPEQAEMKAALALARRRKLGPFRKPPGGDDRRRKDMAVLARAGFSMGIILNVLKLSAADIDQNDADCAFDLDV